MDIKNNFEDYTGNTGCFVSDHWTSLSKKYWNYANNGGVDRIK